MHTMGPWKVGKQVGDTWCVVTTNPVDGREVRGDDLERYGGTPIARGLTLENARLVAAAPALFRIVENAAAEAMNKGSGYDDMRSVLDSVFTGMP